jgi:hypothetical protein
MTPVALAAALLAAVPRFFETLWAAKIASASKGSIDVEIHPAMQLGGAPPAPFTTRSAMA